jgi:hypothetical protein
MQLNFQQELKAKKESAVARCASCEEAPYKMGDNQMVVAHLQPWRQLHEPGLGAAKECQARGN